MKKTIIFLVLAMVLIGSCAAQNANDAQRIVGTWTQNSSSTVFVFNANGTGTWGGNNFTYGISASGEIYVVPSADGSGIRGLSKLFMSPDGRRMFIGIEMFTKN